jgi:nicotinate phosphoribosyltransferase
MDGHREMLYDWHKLYEDNLSTALTDTFGSEFFFADFSAEQAASWASLRQDSGDPIEFGERAIAIYERYGIDPCSKTIVFSDGLDIDTIVKLADHFSGRINVIFGWGTSLTNDMGLDIPSLNIVMKAVKVNNESTVKLSDDTGKETGPDELVAEYQTVARCAILKKLGAMTLV